MSRRNRLKREKTTVKVVPTAGKSFEADMAERDKTVDTFREIAALGGDITVDLHADLDDGEIQRIIKRYAGVSVKFELVEHDSTVEARDNFRRRWEAAGGPALANKSKSDEGRQNVTTKASQNTRGKYYWVAINGSSVAMSSQALPTTVQVSPVPQLLLGFRAPDEAEEALHFFLTASISDCRRRLQELETRAAHGEIVKFVPSHPEPPTTGQTHWNVATKATATSEAER